MDAREATAILRRVQAGDRAATERLFSLVYDQLRELAAGQMRNSPPGSTLQPTILVHEAFLRLAGRESSWQGRSHFFAVASLAMQQVLKNHIRDRQAAKRGGGWERVTLSGLGGTDAAEDVDIAALNAALEELSSLNERHYRVVLARFLAGLDVEQTAQALGVSERTVKADWRMARAWLAQRLRAS